MKFFMKEVKIGSISIRVNNKTTLINGDRSRFDKIWTPSVIIYSIILVPYKILIFRKNYRVINRMYLTYYKIIGRR